MADASAAAIFAGACGYAGLLLLSETAAAALAACTGLVVCLPLLRAVRPEEPHFALSTIALATVPPPPEELLLTEADRVPEDTVRRPVEILAEVVTERLAPGAKVVRLFDKSVVSTSGELQAGLDRHLHRCKISAAPADASPALREAIVELRRTLR